MTNFHDQAVDQHVRLLQEVAGEQVTYARGSSTLSGLTAVRGQSQFDEAIGDGEASVQTKTIDFIFATDDLVLGGKPIDPQRGDTITDAAGVVYAVLPATGSAPAQTNDGRSNHYRVHTVRTKSSSSV